MFNAEGGSTKKMWWTIPQRCNLIFVAKCFPIYIIIHDIHGKLPYSGLGFKMDFCCLFDYCSYLCITN